MDGEIGQFTCLSDAQPGMEERAAVLRSLNIYAPVPLLCLFLPPEWQVHSRLPALLLPGCF